MSQAFVVEVTEKPLVTPPESLESLARAFRIEPRKVELMLRRLPGVATKPISQQEAAVVATYFEKAGLKTNLKSVTPAPVTGEMTPQEPTPEQVQASATEEMQASRVEASSADSDLEESQEATLSDLDAPPIEVEPLEDQPIVSREDVSEITELLNMSPVKLEPVAELDSQPTSKLEFPNESFEHLAQADFQFQSSKSDDHDLLRSTLIRDPDPRKTMTDSKPAKRTIPDLDPKKTMTGLRRDVRKTLTEAEPVPPLAIEALQPPKRRGGVRRELLLAALLPSIVALLGTLGVAYFRLQPVLREGLWESARTPAIATAASISSVLTTTPDGQLDYAQLQRTIDSTRQAFDRQHVSFIAATDAQGNLVSAWFAGGGNDSEGNNLQDAIREQALLAITQGTKSLIPLVQGQLEVVSQPLMLDGKSVGAIVVGVTNQGVQQDIWSTIASVAIYSLIPLLLATLLAILFARPLARKVLYLTDRADQISRGELADSVEVKSNDELGDLGESLERMRVSMQEALERLRRRRS